MPLLHKKPFSPEPLPSNLRPEEEVFVCKATQEVFRDYEKFFNRHFLCNSYVWTCSLTGQSNLTYTQALTSEREAQKLLDSFAECYQRAVLELVHHAHRTNMRTLTDELCLFFKERYVVGERLDLVQTTSSGAKVLRPVSVVKVIAPEPQPSSPSPLKLPVITLSASQRSSPEGAQKSPGSQPPNGVTSPTPQVSSSPPQTLTNGPTVPSSSPSSSSHIPPPPNCFKTPKPVTPRTPLSSEAALNPTNYKYVVEPVTEGLGRMLVASKQLSRPKGQLNPKKLKLFLRNAVFREGEKHPFLVKDEYVQKFNFGPSLVPHEPLPSPSSGRSRKRTLSQASLDSFLATGEGKKQRPASLDTIPSAAKPKARRATPKSARQRRPSGRGGKGPRGRAPSSSTTPRARPKTPQSPSVKTPRSPTKTPRTPPKTPRSKMEALKVLNKAKKFRQMDLKRSVSKRGPLSAEEMAELQRRTEEERQQWVEQREMEKRRRQEERVERLKKAQEQRRLERLRQRELMKPREDLLCGDSKPLPQPTLVSTALPHELLGDAIMVLEFLQSFGPLFNIREVIRESITFEKIERCLLRSDTDTVLFAVVRFLMQAVFAAMEEEHEAHINLKDIISQGEEGGKGEEAGKEERKVAPEDIEQGRKWEEEPKESQEEVETEEKEEGEDAEEEEEKPLDIQVETIRASASSFAQWSQQTQRLPLYQLVVDPYTCSEVLRLHLLASSGYSATSERKLFRYHRRGGYSDGDDPAIALRLRRPDLLDTLGRLSIYDLPPRDKLEVLLTLCTQLLTYSVAREYVEECGVRAKRARRRIREIQNMEERRRREAHQLKAKERKKLISGKGESGKPRADGPTPPTATKPTQVEGGVAQGPVASHAPDALENSHKEGEGQQQEQGQGQQQEQGEGQGQGEDPRETEEERKVRVEEELAELHEELADASNSINLRPLGEDRYYHRYWLFPNLPGILVEDMGLSLEQNTLPQPPALPSPPPLIHHTPSPSHMQRCLSAQTFLTTPSLPALPTSTLLTSAVKPEPSAPLLPNGHPLPPPPTLVSLPQVEHRAGSVDQEEQQWPLPQSTAAVEQEPVGQGSTEEPVEQGSRVAWYYYSKPEEVEALAAVLNVRGVRENALKTALNLHKPLLLRTVGKCPFAKVDQNKQRSPPSAHGLRYESADQYLELYLREQILDTEEKIHIGNLGHLRGAQGRDEWRKNIENSGAAASVSSGKDKSHREDEGEGAEEGEGGEEAGPSPGHDKEEQLHSISSAGADESCRLKSGVQTPSTDPQVHMLSQALLDIQAGIEPKFLMPPLGSAVDEKKRQKVRGTKKLVKDTDVCLEQWRASLAQSTSFSQVFVHLATLERAVMWSRSLMNVRCRICRRKGGDEYMLLCDGCDHGYHTYCLRPPLLSVPEGDWFCHDCSPVTPVKPRQRTQRVTFQEVESSDSESEAGEGGEVESEEEDEEEEEEEDEEEEEEEEKVSSRSLRSRHSRGRAPHLRRSGRLHSKPQKRQKRQRRAEPKPAKKLPRARAASPVRAKKRLKLDSHPPSVSKAESIVSAIIDLRCLQGSHHMSSAARREQRGLEMQLCEALWMEVSGQKESWPFMEPVKKKEYPDYLDTVAQPMDLRTIRCKIKRGTYSSIDDLVTDMELIFTNCQLYHRRHSEIGKAGTALKKYFEKRCSDLGLKDLALLTVEPGSTRLRSSSRKRK